VSSFLEEAWKQTCGNSIFKTRLLRLRSQWRRIHFDRRENTWPNTLPPHPIPLPTGRGHNIWLLADAGATNSNHCWNIRPYQNTACSATLFISNTIQKSNPTTLARNELWGNSEKLKHQ